MKNRWVYGVLLASTLIISCSPLIPESREARVMRRVTSIDLSASPYGIFFSLDSLCANPELVLGKPDSAKFASCPIDFIRCDLPDSTRLRVEVYDILGNLRFMWEGRKLTAGVYELEFGDLGLERSIYFVRLSVNDQQSVVHRLSL